MQIEYIKESEAPAPPRKMTKSAQQVLSALTNMKDNQVIRVRPDEGQTLRGLKSAFARVATSHKYEIQTYEAAEEPGALFVRKTK